VRKRDVEELRAVGLSDTDILLIATAIAYHNYSIRMAAAFNVLSRQPERRIPALQSQFRFARPFFAVQAKRF